jgi:AcrR family transcriptional regulator
MSVTGDRLQDPGARQARAARILDAAAELLLRHGYRRVTVDDVASRAGIGKGTVYLHWKTREDLFKAVFEREVLEAVGELVRTLREDPEAWMLHRLARSYFLAIVRRPLLKAVFLVDTELLGKLARPGSGAREQRHRLASHAYLELLAEHGLLRTDLSPDAIDYAFMAMLEGFIQAEAAVDEQLGSGIEERADVLALTVQRAFESGRSLSPATGRAVAAQVADLFARVGESDRGDLAPCPSSGRCAAPGVIAALVTGTSGDLREAPISIAACSSSARGWCNAATSDRTPAERRPGRPPGRGHAAARASASGITRAVAVAISASSPSTRTASRNTRSPSRWTTRPLAKILPGRSGRRKFTLSCCVD